YRISKSASVNSRRSNRSVSTTIAAVMLGLTAGCCGDLPAERTCVFVEQRGERVQLPFRTRFGWRQWFRGSILLGAKPVPVATHLVFREVGVGSHPRLEVIIETTRQDRLFV